MNTFKEKLKAGKHLIGFEVDLADPCIAEMVGGLGFDYLWIDTEHEAMDYETVLMQIIACKAAGAASVVRIPFNESYLAKRVLEMGPDGIIFPMINSAEEAKAAMEACIYPPNGKRGFGPRRACRYGAEDLGLYIEEASDRMARFIQIENVEAVNDIDRILRVPYIDGIIVGPCDLSGSIGHLNELFHPEVLKLIDIVISKCKDVGMPVGVAVGANDEKSLQFWFDRGFQFISAGSDINAIVSTAQLQSAMMRRIFTD